MVVVRFAVALPKICTFADIRQAVPFLTDINWQRLVWLHPLLQSTEQSFRLHDGMCILLQMPPEHESESQSLSVDQAPEDTSLVQVSVRSTSALSSHAKEPLPTAPVCSIMDELLNAVNAANNAIDNQLPPIDQFSIEAQPESFRDLWERITDNQVGFEPDASRTHRLESWFLDHTDERKQIACSLGLSLSMRIFFHGDMQFLPHGATDLPLAQTLHYQLYTQPRKMLPLVSLLRSLLHRIMLSTFGQL